MGKTKFIEYAKGVISTLVAICVAFIFNMALIEKSITLFSAFWKSLLFILGGWIFIVILNKTQE